jgi:hypothetical protein
MNPIYVIQSQRERDTDYGSYTESDLETDYGYFETEEEAQAFADALDKGPMARWEQEKADYEQAVNEWRAKNEEARALGYRTLAEYPRWVNANDRPLPHEVVEILPAKKQNGTVV